jgi:flavin reductase (DIM6/NTAB) family NADH-FMN oxidoreductase RutF
MAIDPSEFRRIMGHWVSGVAIVASRKPGGEPCGLTATAVTSLSLDPPLVLVCIDRAADSNECIRRAGVFTVNVLDGDSELLARRFASSELADKFGLIPHRSAPSGAPVLEAALAWVDCELVETVPGGDHMIFIGRVQAGDGRPGAPLLHHRGTYARLTD